MNPKVSVVIPAYNQADYIAEAIKSVIDQSYTDWEMIVVDDGSTDATAQVVNQFQEPRLRYVYQKNKGLPGARNTGIAQAKGQHLAFLDSDDLYHPDKLLLQVAHLDQNPEIGLSYTSRIGIDADGQPLTFYRTVKTASLKDLVLGFPFTINDLLVRRPLVEQIHGFDESFRLNSEDRDFYIRLALNGCRFEGITNFLAYRRFHPGRTFKNIPAKMKTYVRALETAFSDPRCPAEVLAVRDQAYAEQYLAWAYQTLAQGEAELGEKYLRKSIELDSTILDQNATRLLKLIVGTSIRDGGDHVNALQAIFNHLPADFDWLVARHQWVIAQGFYMRGLREIMWDRVKEGRHCLKQAVDMQIPPEEQILNTIADQLFSYEIMFGVDAVQDRVDKISGYLRKFGAAAQGRWLRSHFALNQAFKDYHQNDFSKVPSKIIQAVSNEPKHLKNRGVLSMLFRSIFGILRRTDAS